MTPVYQTKYGYGQGNCLLACVASLLHKKIEEIPDFNLSGIGWFEELYEYCLNENHGLILLNPKDIESALVLNCDVIMLFDVVDFPDEMHAVIGRCARKAKRPCPDSLDKSEWEWQADIVHDPNRKGGFKLGDLRHIVLLLPRTVNG